MNLACPQCKSGDVRRLSLVYKEGAAEVATTSTGSGIGIGAGGLGFGVGRSKTQGTQQSLLSKEVAPPTKMKWGGLALVCVIGALLALPTLLAGDSVGLGLFELVVAGVAGWQVKKRWAFNSDDYPNLLARWQDSFLCTRCGERFEASA